MTLTAIFFIWIVGGGALSLFIRRLAARALAKLPLPVFFSYLLLATPLILIEEWLTCETPYLNCLTVTYPAFLIIFALLAGLIKIFKLKTWPAVAAFGFMGWINEFILVDRLADWSGLVLILMSVLAFLIYAILAIMPVTLLTKDF